MQSALYLSYFWDVTLFGFGTEGVLDDDAVDAVAEVEVTDVDEIDVDFGFDGVTVVDAKWCYCYCQSNSINHWH